MNSQDFEKGEDILRALDTAKRAVCSVLDNLQKHPERLRGADPDFKEYADDRGELTRMRVENERLETELKQAKETAQDQRDQRDNAVREMDACHNALRQQLEEAQRQLAAFHAAMERERKPDWEKWHMDLANRLEVWAKEFQPRAAKHGDLTTAARELRSMATDFTLKANFVPAELKIKELEKQLEEETKATNYAAAKMAGQREHIAQLEGKLEESQNQVAQLREAASDFIWNVEHSHVPGWGDVSRDTVADNSFKELKKSLASTPSPDFIHFQMPKLMPSTAKLVLDFAKAMADKLAAAEAKYGYGDSWATPDAEDWPDPLCYERLMDHLAKGDPRDVANYCAFLWFHKLGTKPCLKDFIHKRELVKLLNYISEHAALADKSSREWVNYGSASENAAYRAGMWYAYNDIRNRLPIESLTKQEPTQ